jgi:hypothetical protein
LFANNGIASEAYEKIQDFSMPRAQFKNRYDSLPTLQLSLKIIALFEKIYDGNIVDSWRMYKKVCDVKSVTQPTLCCYWKTIMEFK